MAAIEDEKDRTVIPRWRLSILQTSRTDLASLRPRKERLLLPDLADLLADWTDTGGISVAAELVAASLLHRDFRTAIEAACFLVGDVRTPDAARSLAEFYLLGESSPVEPMDEIYTVDELQGIRLQVRHLRHSLRQYPKDALGWSDLALCFTTLGLPKKAAAAMKVALGISPNNRHIVRAASRMIQHAGDPEKAHWFLLRSPALAADPWISSAEAALATACQKVTPNFRVYRKWLLDGKFAPRHLSELASALGTVAAMQGDHKIARKFLRMSLEAPTENAVAQAIWLARHRPAIGIEAVISHASFEGNASYAIQKNDWEGSLKWSRRWQSDQIFSSRPAIQASFIASLALEQYEVSAEVARLGLVANPDDPSLQNNLAFSLAHLGHVSEAAKLLSTVLVTHADSGARIAITATRGLIAFRSGRMLEGQQLYTEAIALADAQKDPRAYQARIFLAMELLRCGEPKAEALRNDLVSAGPDPRFPASKLLLERLRKMQLVRSARASPTSR